ncbi:hypothetical protein VSS37_13445 [Candidatus Thiothrix sp. Deng01]|uniref:Uncharacterized protein n=1 Tax=Candidatus Thiothrix phosphatis TaxID=3112415 RepID=A0ABU6CZL0_9GAMM|nr:hypothetical protein [Candidatus Thiothrix sp. Deng01]MEB4591992.1 hypothetical protein [Candidatus Thiothrix sp. Deng01]
MNEQFTIPALRIIEDSASDEKLMEKQRMQEVKVFFDKPSVKQVLIQHIALTKDVCAPALQKEAIIQIASQCKPGAPVNLRDLEDSVSVDGVTTNFTRNYLIPALQRAGLFIPKPNGANGWLWAELQAPSAMDTAKQLLGKAAGLATPENPELVEEQRKLAVEQQLSEVAKRRLLLAKQNAKLIAEASKLHEENEAELLKRPIQPVGRNNPNKPAMWAAGVAALVLGAVLLHNHSGEDLPTQQAAAAAAEPAPDYNSMTDEDILKLQMGDRWGQLSEGQQEQMIDELKQQRVAMAQGKI